MALEFTMVPVNLTGMDTKTDTFVLNPGAASEMKNIWMDRSGKYQKRAGYVELAELVSDGVTVSDWHGDILRWRQTSVEKIDTAGVRQTNVTFLSGKYEMNDIGGDLTVTDEFSYAEGPDYGVFVKCWSGISVEIQFIDLQSRKCFYNEVISSRTIAGPVIFNTTKIQAVATATGVAVVMWEPASGTAYITLDHWVGFDASGYPTRTIESLTMDNGTVFGRVDICHIDGYVAAAYDSGSSVYLAIANLAAGTASNSQVTTDAPTRLTIAKKDATTGVVLWCFGTTDREFEYREFAVSSGPTGSATALNTKAGYNYDPSRMTLLWDGSKYHFAWDWDADALTATGGAPGPNYVEHYISTTATRQDLDTRAQIASRMFIYNGEVMLYETSAEVSGDDTNISASLRTFGSPTWPKWSDQLLQGRTRPASVDGSMSGIEVFSGVIIGALPWAGNRKTQAKLIERTISGKPTFSYFNNVLLNNVTPHLSAYDGRDMFPAGFPSWPVITALTAAGSGSFSGTYGLSALWERVDNEGNVWRSAPSLVATVVASTNSMFNVTVAPPPFHDATTDQFSLVIYRTTANGTIFYRVGSSIASTTSTTVVDVLPDADLSDNPLLYVDGGALENVMPPAVEAWIVARERVFVISAEDGDLYPSKLRISGEGLGFSDALRISIESDSGLTALGAMDEKVVVFGEESYSVLYGVGPDDFGAGQFELQMLSDALGCIEPRSIMLGDAGLFFQSRKGLWLLGRDLSSNGIGIPVDLYKSATIVGAMSPSDRMFHWWYLSTGTILVWDEYHSRWSRFLTSGALGAVLVDQKPVFLTATGQVFREDTTIFQDDGVDYECQVTLGWISFAGLQGFQKVRRVSILGESQTPAFSAVCKLAYDFVATATETITAANATVKPTGTAYQWEFKPQRQKCESIRLDITWTSTGAGASITGLAFEVGGIPGIARRVKTAKRVKGV